jgi:DNA polymerase-4
MPRTIFHLDMDAFFVAVERILDPSLIGIPVVVGGEVGSRGVVACASYEARKFGLHAGMPLAQAYRLCPHAKYISCHYERYTEISASFMSILASYSPFIESMGLDEAYMDMSGADLLFGPPEDVARAIKQRVRDDLRVVVSIGIATSKVVAKVASDASKPDGLLRVPVGGEAAFLAPRPVRDIPGVGEKTEPVLKRMGINTIGDIAAAPVMTLRHAFGVWGEVLWRNASGLDDSPVAGRGDPKSISRETTFAQDTLDPAILRGTLRYLTERVCAELRQQQMLAREVHICLRWDDFTTISRQRTLPRHVRSDEAVFTGAWSLIEKELAAEAKGKHRAVRLIGVGVGDLEKDAGQLALLQPEREDRLAQALDAIRAKHGYAAVHTGLTHQFGEDLPERHGHHLLRRISHKSD